MFVKTNGAESQSGQVVASAQEEIRRLGRNGNALRPEEASSISAGGKIVGRGALTIFGHVEGELRASTIVIAEGAQMAPIEGNGKSSSMGAVWPRPCARR